MEKQSPKLQIQFEGEKLADMDLFSKSDPFLVLYADFSPARTFTTLQTRLIDDTTGRGDGVSDETRKVVTCKGRRKSGKGWVEIGRTETLWNTLSPSWQTTFVIPYNKGWPQKLKMEVYDNDAKNSEKLKKHDFIGYAETSVQDIIGSRALQRKLKLINPKLSKPGSLTITIEEENNHHDNENLKLNIGCQFAKCGLRVPKPFFEIWRRRKDGHFTIAYRSRRGKSSASGKGLRRFQFPVCDIDSRFLCNTDGDRQLRIDFLLSKKSGAHRRVGSIITSINKLKSMKGGEPVSLVMRDSNRREVGKVWFHDINFHKRSTVRDYIDSGYKIHLVVAIDFRSFILHNQKDIPRAPQSMRARYDKAIQEIGKMVADYATDPWIRGFGFGAQIPSDKRRRPSIFSLTGDPLALCEGLQGLLYAYRSFLDTHLRLAPTKLAGVIKEVAKKKFPDAGQNLQHYTVLLVFVDGLVDDLHDTVDQIIHASFLPISILIVCLGKICGWCNVEVLDSTYGLLVSERTGETMFRHMVQLYPYRSFQEVPEVLENEALEEISDQILNHMELRGISPAELIEGVETCYDGKALRISSTPGVLSSDIQVGEYVHGLKSRTSSLQKFENMEKFWLSSNGTKDTNNLTLRSFSLSHGGRPRSSSLRKTRSTVCAKEDSKLLVAPLPRPNTTNNARKIPNEDRTENPWTVQPSTKTRLSSSRPNFPAGLLPIPPLPKTRSGTLVPNGRSSSWDTVTDRAGTAGHS